MRVSLSLFISPAFLTCHLSVLAAAGCNVAGRGQLLSQLGSIALMQHFSK